jgi:carbamoyltransferase
MNILGISCYYHDAAAALVKDGILVAAAEEERFTRKKHDPSFPECAIRFCLEAGSIPREGLDYIVFYEKPLVKFERVLRTTIGTFPRSWELFREAMIGWMNEKLWVKERLASELGVSGDRVLFVDHHMSHAASAFFCSPFREAAILTVDGVGEWATATTGRASACWDGAGRNHIQLDQHLPFPHSLGLLYSTFTAFLGFEVNEGEYKVMGMAPYGQPKYLDKILKLASVSADGSLRLNLEYFSFPWSVRQSYSRRFLDLFGEARLPGSEFRLHQENGGDSASAEKDQFYADVAASIQAFTEDVLLKMACELHRQTGLPALCMAGGVALNSVANGRILRESGFEQLFIQPAAGDSGGAVGAALYAYHVLLGEPRKFVLENAYLGREFTAAEISTFLNQQGIRYESFDDDDKLLDRVTERLTQGKVVGWFQGRFEWGPRALGNRSILADPRRAEMKDIVNEKIKFREPFRPFAPVLPEDQASTFFEATPEEVSQYPARYMLLVLPWRGSAGSRVPAVNHLGTGRLQTLQESWNPRYHSLLRRFGQATGTPVLMNTSFNLRGEPIVASPADAWNTFSKSGIDILVLDRVLIEK